MGVDPRLERSDSVFARVHIPLESELIHVPFDDSGRWTRSGISPLASMGTPLTFARDGQFTYNLFQHSGSMPLYSRGPLPFEHFAYYGNERSLDIQGEPAGKAGFAQIYQDMTPYGFDPTRDLPHPDGRIRRAHPGQEFVVYGESADLKSGSIRDVQSTPASAAIKCTASNSFVYRGAPGTDGEIYVGMFGITPGWIKAPNFGPAGTFYFYIINATSGKQLIAKDYASFGIPAGRFAISALEYDLFTHLSADVTPGDIIRIELVHQVYSFLDPGSHTIGAAAGFAFISTHLA